MFRELCGEIDRFGLLNKFDARAVWVAGNALQHLEDQWLGRLEADKPLLSGVPKMVTKPRKLEPLIDANGYGRGQFNAKTPRR